MCFNPSHQTWKKTLDLHNKVLNKNFKYSNKACKSPKTFANLLLKKIQQIAKIVKTLPKYAPQKAQNLEESNLYDKTAYDLAYILPEHHKFYATIGCKVVPCS